MQLSALRQRCTDAIVAGIEMKRRAHRHRRKCTSTGRVPLTLPCAWHMLGAQVRIESSIAHPRTPGARHMRMPFRLLLSIAAGLAWIAAATPADAGVSHGLAVRPHMTAPADVHDIALRRHRKAVHRHAHGRHGAAHARKHGRRALHVHARGKHATHRRSHHRHDGGHTAAPRVLERSISRPAGSPAQPALKSGAPIRPGMIH